MMTVFFFTIEKQHLFFITSIANAKSAPDSFADLAEKLSPSVVNISTTTVIEQRAREMGKSAQAAVYRKFINQMKKKTKAKASRAPATANPALAMCGESSPVEAKYF